MRAGTLSGRRLHAQVELLPPEPDQLSDEEWADYLFMRKNPRGRHLEQWCHAHGCRQWFNAERDTVTSEIVRVYRVE